MNPLIDPDFLRIRRSASIKSLSNPGPTQEQLNDILTIATRVPDHGKLHPWYLVLFQGDSRTKFGHILSARWAQTHTDATQEQLTFEAQRFLRAPLVVAVISRIREAKIPKWEQLLSAGALCYNLCLAANSYGFGANWITEWYAYDEDIRRALSCEDKRDHIAGFIYIGTEISKQADRERPDLDKISSHWPDPAQKGDEYNKSGFGLPNSDFNY